MKVKLVDKYIFSQVLLAGAVCVLLFMVIWIAPELLLKTIQRTLSGQYTIRMGVGILLFEIPKILGNALPVGLLLGTLFTFDKLSKDFELSIFRGIGLSFNRIITPVIALSILVSALSFFVQDRMIPYSSTKLNIIKDENESSHFVFPMKDKSGRMKKIVIVSNFDPKTINDVVVLNFASDEYLGSSLLESIMVSDFARYNDGEWKFDDAKRYLISPDGIFRSVKTEKNTVILSGELGRSAHKLMSYSIKKDRELTNSELYKYMKLLGTHGMDDEHRFMLNKLLQRYTHSLMCLLFAVFGCLLGFSQPREQRLIGFTVAVATIFLYYITMPFFDMLAEKGILSPLITSTIQPVAILAAIIWLKRKKDL